jgi:hypothetical protein
LPTTIEVEAVKASSSTFENCISSPRHGRKGSVRILQIQRTLRLIAVRARSGIPNPPNRCGRHTLAQLTWQWPPLASALPAQRNPRRILLTCFSVFLSRPSTISWCKGIAARTARISAKRQAPCPRHHGCPPGRKFVSYSVHQGLEGCSRQYPDGEWDTQVLDRELRQLALHEPSGASGLFIRACYGGD